MIRRCIYYEHQKGGEGRKGVKEGKNEKDENFLAVMFSQGFVGKNLKASLVSLYVLYLFECRNALFIVSKRD